MYPPCLCWSTCESTSVLTSILPAAVPSSGPGAFGRVSPAAIRLFLCCAVIQPCYHSRLLGSWFLLCCRHLSLEFPGMLHFSGLRQFACLSSELQSLSIIGVWFAVSFGVFPMPSAFVYLDSRHPLLCSTVLAACPEYHDVTLLPSLLLIPFWTFSDRPACQAAW